MELHNPRNLNLPPLLVEKQDNRLALEADKHIQNFIKSNKLLNLEFYELFSGILKVTERITNLAYYLRNLKGDEYNVYSGAKKAYIFLRQDIPPIRKKPIEIKEFYNTWEISADEGEELEKLVEDFKLENIQEHNEKLISMIRNLSEENQNNLSNFEHLNNVDLDILETTTLFLCGNCYGPIAKGKFLRKVCNCGFSVNKLSDSRVETLYLFSEKVSSFISNNYWLEYGIDYLLRKKSLSTLCGYYVLGHSGNKHEIDNIAESKSENLRFLCECKTGEIKPNDIFIFAGKMADIGCTRGFMFTLSDGVTKESILLGRSRNISIISNVLKRAEASLLDEIKA